MIKKTIHFFICMIFASTVIAQEKTIELPLIGDRLSGAVSETEEQALGRQFLRDLKKDAKILYDPIVQEWTELFIYKIGENSKVNKKTFEDTISLIISSFHENYKNDISSKKIRDFFHSIKEKKYLSSK